MSHFSQGITELPKSYSLLMGLWAIFSEGITELPKSYSLWMGLWAIFSEGNTELLKSYSVLRVSESFLARGFLDAMRVDRCVEFVPDI